MSTKQHWFWGSVANFKSLFVRIGLAAVMINLLSVASSIFIMVVYDRVIPNAAFPLVVCVNRRHGCGLDF